jgi:hypothetical protein
MVEHLHSKPGVLAYILKCIYVHKCVFDIYFIFGTI